MKEKQYTSKGRRLLVSIVLIMGLALTHAQAAPYPDMTVHEPTTEYPTNFAPFDVSAIVTMAQPSNGTPQIAEWTRQNNPGDTMALTGEALSIYKTEEDEGQDTRFVIYGEGKPVADCLIQRLDGRQCAITLPKNLPQNEMYLMWPHNEYGYGEPVPINQTEAWWVGPDLVSTGETFSIYGQNLELGDGRCYAHIDGYGWITTSTANPYKADFTVPASLKNGTYTIHAHNGHGGKYGWSDAQKITVKDAIIWNNDKSTWYNVKDYDAVGDGVADDSAAIISAIDAASAVDWSTVYFPTGTYAVGSYILLWGDDQMRLLGDGMDATVIKPSRDLHPYPIISVRSDNVEIKDMEINVDIYNCAMGINVEQVDNIKFDRVRLSSLDHLSGEHIIKCLSSTHLLFKNCEFIVSYSMWNANVTGIVFDSCTFLGVHDCNSFTGGNASQFSAFNCTARSYDDSDATTGAGWCKGRWITGSNYGMNNVYIGDSATQNMSPRFSDPFYVGHPVAVGPLVWADPTKTTRTDKVRQRYIFSDLNREEPGTISAAVDYSGEGARPNWGSSIHSWDFLTGEVWLENYAHNLTSEGNTNAVVLFWDSVDQNASEQIMFEGGASRYRGSASQITPRSVTFSNLEAYNIPSTTYSYLVVVDGRGLGQCRKIVAVNGGTVTLDEPWRVLPDSESIFTHGRYGSRWIVYNNYLDGVDRSKWPSAAQYSASSGFQVHGSGHSMIADGNTICETKTGIGSYSEAHSGFISSENTISPVYFCSYKNNTLSNCLSASLINSIGIRPDKLDPYADVAVLGSVWRNNMLIGTVGTAIENGGSNGDQTHVALTIFDHNTATNFGTCITGASGMKNQIVVNNTFKGSGASEGMNLFSNYAPLFNGNTWNGFLEKYRGDLPGALLELPKRVAKINDGSTVDIPIWNSGTASMNWSAGSDSVWLEVLTPRGSVTNENSEGTLSLKLVSPAPDVGSKAVVTVTGGSQTRKITVVYEGEGRVIVSGKNDYVFPGMVGRKLKVEVIESASKTAATETFNKPRVILDTIYFVPDADPFILFIPYYKKPNFLELYEDDGRSGWNPIQMPGVPAGKRLSRETER